MVTFDITNTAQEQIKQAIRWLDKTVSKDTARDTIKELMMNFKNQLSEMPESGKKCQYLNSDSIREMVKGQYRFVYRLDINKDSFNVTLIMFCHTRMDYATLLNVSLNVS